MTKEKIEQIMPLIHKINSITGIDNGSYINRLENLFEKFNYNQTEEIINQILKNFNKNYNKLKFLTSLEIINQIEYIMKNSTYIYGNDFTKNVSNKVNINSVKEIFEVLELLKVESQKIEYFLKQYSSSKNNHIALTFPKLFWFRGQSDSRWKLEPSLFRTICLDGKNTGRYYNEWGLMQEFKAKHKHLFSVGYSDLDFYTTMQHYGLPTRLLDWTENILYALYFAVQDENKTADGQIVVLIPSLFNSFLQENLCYITDILFESHTFLHDTINYNTNITRNLKFNEIMKKENNYLAPVALYPNQSNERIKRQMGMFTYHGGIMGHTDDFKPISIEEINEQLYHKALGYFSIPADRKKIIKEELNSLCINESTLFPEIEYQSKYLKKLYEY